MSTSPNVLNLDEMAITRTVILKGKERKLRSMTVGEFIDNADLDDTLKSKSAKEQIKVLIVEIVKYMEDTSEDELKGLELTQLTGLLSFIRGSDVNTGSEEGNPPKA